MNEYLDKIRQEIEKNKSDIITELDSFDVSILGNINSNISTAKNIITQLSNDNEIDFSIISSRVKIAEISKKDAPLQSIIIFLQFFNLSIFSSKLEAVPKNKDPFTFSILISSFSMASIISSVRLAIWGIVL